MAGRYFGLAPVCFSPIGALSGGSTVAEALALAFGAVVNVSPG